MDAARRLKTCSELLDLATEPRDKAEALAGRAKAYMDLREFDRAVADSEAALAYVPDDLAYRWSLAQAHSRRAGAAMEKGDYDEALRELDRTLQIDPQDGYALQQKAWIYLEQRGESAKAIEQYSIAIELKLTRSWTKQNRSDAYFERGRLLAEGGHFDKAIDDYDMALALAPYDPHAIKGWRCLARLVSGKSAEATQDCEQTIALQNQDPLKLTPVILIWLGRLSEAEAVANKIKDMQHSPYASYVLGMVAEARGNTAEAEKKFAEAREIASKESVEIFNRFEREERPYRKPHKP
jgi:tetratricopeptide (TPR) repeat protein